MHIYERLCACFLKVLQIVQVWMFESYGVVLSSFLKRLYVHCIPAICNVPNAESCNFALNVDFYVK